MHMKYSLILLFSIVFPLYSTTVPVTNEFVVLVISQPHIYVLSQIHNISTLIPSHIPLLYAHSYASSLPNWYAIYPILPSIMRQYVQLKWLFICEPQTRFDLTRLLAFTEETNDSYIGHGLYDSEPSIIHHYSFSLEKPYPDFASGLLLSRHVLSLFLDRYLSYARPIDFIIDVKYEFNQLINELTNITLSDRPDQFCIQRKENCLTWFDDTHEYSCQRKDIHADDIYFGIKTFVGYHRTRLDTLRKAWLHDQLHYNLFTNEMNDVQSDRFIVTAENTERGHCHKTFTIFNYFYKNKENFKYLVIADDDTLLSVPRLVRLLRCLMLTDDLPIVLGERYGYGSYYDYPTGGSGMIFNRQAVQQILANCQCPASDTPDDMFVGLCLRRIDVPLTHVPELHQAQPSAYSKEWLQHQKAISFHKFEGINVDDVYRTYLHETSSDETTSSPRHKNEL